MIDANRESGLRQDVEALYFGYRAFTALPDRTLADRGLGRAHHRILYFVQRQPDISMSDLLGLLKVTKQAIHRPLKDLESLGLLTVTPDAEDKRARRLAVTAAGAQLEGELTGAQTRLLESVFADFDAPAQSHWRAIMARLAELDE